MKMLRRAGRARSRGLAAVLLAAAVNGVTAQVTARAPSYTLHVSVVDAVTNRPLPGAALDVIGDSLRRSVRSDERGEATVSLATGAYELTTRRLGYEVAVAHLRMPRRDSAMTILLTPSAVPLPRVQVDARLPGVYGAVARLNDLHPVSGARLQVIGSNKSTETDSAGRYHVTLPKRGTYVIRATKSGYADQMVTVQVPDSAIEAVVLLDTGTVASTPEALLQEFDERLRWQSHGAAIVAGSDLRRYGATTAVALAAASGVIRRGLHIGPDICLFVNGIPRPYLPVDAIPVEAIENVEVYTVRGEVTSTLQHEWPPGIQCGDGRTKPNGKVAAGSDAGAVRFVVIWLRR